MRTNVINPPRTDMLLLVYSLALQRLFFLRWDSMACRPAPDFTLEQAYGGRVDLSAYRGKAVLLIFWLTACGICRHELPLLDRLSTEFRSRGFEGYSAPPLNEPLSMQTAKPLSATTSRVCPRLC
ncbi:MAG: hypothetical protein DMG57_38365 [Acidobacteria bacterium]|nr:MAG: hypothetical protein DMG57_38365 [Acidobacteriota bacterium]